MGTLQELLGLIEKGRLVTGPDPKPRPNLILFCRNVEQEFDSVVREFNSVVPEDEILHKLTAVYNRAALAHYHFGDYDRAEHLCHKAIALCASEEHHRSKFWMLAILQPYVNLARIAGAKGNWIQAREILHGVFDFTERGECLRLGDCLLHESKKPAGQEERDEIKGFGRAVFINDSLRVLLLGDCPQELLTFTDTLLQSNLARNPEFWMMLTEARTRAFLALSQYPEALALLNEMLARMKVSGRIHPGTYCMVAEVYSRQGNISQAQEMVLRMDRAYARALERSNKHLATLNFLGSLAFSELRLGLHENARNHARAAMDLADRLEDEGGKLKAMALFTLSSSFQGTAARTDAAWHADFCNLLLNTYYRLERIIGCCIAAHSSCAPEYIGVENGRALVEHALHLCGQETDGLFGEASRLIKATSNIESSMDTGGMTTTRQFSHPVISSVYDCLISFTVQKHTLIAHPAQKSA